MLAKQPEDHVLLVLRYPENHLVTLGQPHSLSPIQFFVEKIEAGSIIYTTSSCTKFRWIDDDDNNDGSGTQQTFLEGIHQFGQRSAQTDVLQRAFVNKSKAMYFPKYTVT